MWAEITQLFWKPTRLFGFFVTLDTSQKNVHLARTNRWISQVESGEKELLEKHNGQLENWKC